MLVDATGNSAASAVTGAIRGAAQATGTSFEYLLATAQVESGFNPHATASTSSAGGLYQFIDQTWLGMLKDAGPGLGYGRYADAITKTAAGHYDVADPAMRAEIMALRKDPAANAAMAGAFTRQNAAQLTTELGRNPSDGELYIAHFLGPVGAAKLISAAGSSPQASAAAIFPSAAAANHSIFYDKHGAARSVSDVYGALVGRYDSARAGPAAQSNGDVPIPPADIPPAAAGASTSGSGGVLANPGPLASIATAASDAATGAQSADTQVFHGLYRAEQRRGGVNPVVQELWGSRTSLVSDPNPSSTPAAGAAAKSDTQNRAGFQSLFSDQPANVRALFGKSG
jgi:Transglycosylase SLT domain